MPSALVSLLLSSLISATDIPPGSPSIRFLGRVQVENGVARWDWSGSGASVSFLGTSCEARLRGGDGIVGIRVDGRDAGVVDLSSKTDSVIKVAGDLRRGPHVVELRQRTEASLGVVRFGGFRVDGVPLPAQATPARRIAFYGNSITCGFGVLDSSRDHHFSPATEDESSGFAGLASNLLSADRQTVCWSGRGALRNFGGDTTAPLLPELADRVLASGTATKRDPASWVPDAIVVDLGHNDFSVAPPPDSARFESAVERFCRHLHSDAPRAKIVLVDGPMTNDFWPTGLRALSLLRGHLDRVAARLASEGIPVSRLRFTPNDPARGYGADWHPNRAQARLNADELAAHLRRTMGW